MIDFFFSLFSSSTCFYFFRIFSIWTYKISSSICHDETKYDTSTKRSCVPLFDFTFLQQTGQGIAGYGPLICFTTFFFFFFLLFLRTIFGSYGSILLRIKSVEIGMKTGIWPFSKDRVLFKSAIVLFYTFYNKSVFDFAYHKRIFPQRSAMNFLPSRSGHELPEAIT